MKSSIFFIFIIIISLSCNKKGNNSKLEIPKGTAAAPVTPPDSRISKILQTNIWMVEFYISSTDFENGKKNRGRWYQFKKDGTFDSGYWEKKTGSGTWTVEEVSKYPMVKMDSYNDAEDAAWEVQGVPADPTEMSWVGAKDYPNYGDLVKMFNMLTPPTKKQFGEE